MLLAEFRESPQNLINELAVLFLIVRIAYVFTYLGDRPTLRSILWSIGFAINVGIFFLPAVVHGEERALARVSNHERVVHPSRRGHTGRSSG